MQDGEGSAVPQEREGVGAKIGGEVRVFRHKPVAVPGVQGRDEHGALLLGGGLCGEVSPAFK